MSENVQFDMDQQGMPSRPRSSGNSGGFAEGQVFGQTQVSGMAGWLIKKGIVNSELGARGFLFFIVIINFALTGFLVYFFVLK
jgi:hypothetical protein